MDRSIDEVSAISSLVRSLVQQLAESNDNIAKLESIAKAFVPQDEYEQLIQPPLSDSKTDSKNKETKKVPIEEEEAYVIQKLEQERMELVLELQKEDFLKEKLVEVLTQNEDLVETVKEYLESKDSIQKEEEDYVKNRFENYSERVLQPTIDRLDSQLFDLHRGIN
ncbi:hypothetical protein DFJ63DRAFT_334217 [Scheffersomyces coipomensis]|uniref:uncharacterized protein n=1 Tax=Scheffersomyces coipomensis TaxID=1788519 RepID=UPI00315DB263